MRVCAPKSPIITNQGLVPIREHHGGDAREPLGELSQHPLLMLLELYKSSVELLD